MILLRQQMVFRPWNGITGSVIKVDNNIWWLIQHAIPEWQPGTWDTEAFIRYNDIVY